MFTIKNPKVEQKYYENTLAEINQQVEKWEEAWANYQAKKADLDQFFKRIARENAGKLRVIFTGAGTSEYVGNTIVATLAKENKHFSFESIATTNLVSTPKLYLEEDVPTLLVSFARSGNSPESLAAVHLSQKLVRPIYQLAITCAEEGKLAMELKDDPRSFVLLMPEGTNDKGFAMTSSFSSMLLSALLVFSTKSMEEKEASVRRIVTAAKAVRKRSEELNDLADFDFSRIVYLGSGALYGLTNECRLKILELTAGEVAALYESSMGFRHGPKSFINDETFVIGLVSNDDYTRLYDQDILNEVYQDQIAKKTLALTGRKIDAAYPSFLLEEAEEMTDIELALVYVMIAQLIAVIASVHVGNRPDTPSKTGTVNRVVKGVEIHEL